VSEGGGERPRIRVRRRDGASPPGPAAPEGRADVDAGAVPLAARARAREALRCPFCRDAVGGDDAFACGRSGCGALYHQECWDECLAGYGGCAALGCGGKSGRRLSRLGLWARFLRLLAAALVFGPRAYEALRQEQSPERRALMARIRAEARHLHQAMWGRTERSLGCAGRLAASATQLVVALVCLVAAIGAWALVVHLGGPIPLILAGMVTTPVQAVLLAYGLTWPGAVFVLWARAVFRGELAALERLGRPTTIDRMRRGGGK